MQPALCVHRPYRTGCVQDASDPSYTAQRVFLAGHGLDKIDLAELDLLAKNVTQMWFVSVTTAMTVI